MAGQGERLDQRNKVEDQPESDGRLHDFGQQVAALTEQQYGINQSDAIKSDRDSKPNKRHKPQ